MDDLDDLDEQVCPLCCEELDLSDKNFLPCKCGYQVCMWCWHHIKDNLNGLCPACRTPYQDDPHAFSAVDRNEIIKNKKERKQKEKERKEQLAAAKAKPGTAPVVGLPLNAATQHIHIQQQVVGAGPPATNTARMPSGASSSRSSPVQQARTANDSTSLASSLPSSSSSHEELTAMQQQETLTASSSLGAEASPFAPNARAAAAHLGQQHQHLRGAAAAAAGEAQLQQQQQQQQRGSLRHHKVMPTGGRVPPQWDLSAARREAMAAAASKSSSSPKKRAVPLFLSWGATDDFTHSIWSVSYVSPRDSWGSWATTSSGRTHDDPLFNSSAMAAAAATSVLTGDEASSSQAAANAATTTTASSANSGQQQQPRLVSADPLLRNKPYGGSSFWIHPGSTDDAVWGAPPSRPTSSASPSYF